MRVLGLTGSIGMGKSTAAAMLRRLGLPVHDADATVHRLLGPKGAAVADVAAVFPDAVVDGRIDRKRLGAAVFQDAAALGLLEAILHPKAREEALDFLEREARRGSPLVVLDIPLLFETGGEALCDDVLVVTAPAFVQEGRVLSRHGMTQEKLQGIRARQLPEEEKLRRADFIVQTGLDKGFTFRQLARIVRQLRGKGEEAGS